VAALVRRVVAETIGTALLLMAVVGSDIERGPTAAIP
jgi:hypothetical protein